MTLSNYLKTWEEPLALLGIEEDLKEILPTLRELKNRGKILFPHPQDLFNAFSFCDYEDCKLVVLGRVPYTDGSSNGLAYGTTKTIVDTEAYSTTQICMEIANSCYANEFWSDSVLARSVEQIWGPDLATQGVLMLNETLACDKQRDAYYVNLWHSFTEKVIQAIINHKNNPVILTFHKSPFADQLVDAGKVVFQEKFANKATQDMGFLHTNLFTRVNEQIEAQGNKKINF